MFLLNTHKKKMPSTDPHAAVLEKLVFKIVDTILHQLKTDRHFKKKLVSLLLKEASLSTGGKK